MVPEILKKRLLQKSERIFPTKFLGEFCGGFFCGFFGAFFLGRNRRKKSTQKSMAKFKSEFGSFAAKIHTARIWLRNSYVNNSHGKNSSNCSCDLAAENDSLNSAKQCNCKCFFCTLGTRAHAKCISLESLLCNCSCNLARNNNLQNNLLYVLSGQTILSPHRALGWNQTP